MSAESITFTQAPTKVVLTITPEGVKMRDGKPLTELPVDQLLVVIDELVDLIAKR